MPGTLRRNSPIRSFYLPPDDDHLSSDRPSTIASKSSSCTAPCPGSLTATSDSPEMMCALTSRLRKRKREVIELDAFREQLLALVRSKQSAEVAVISLMREYQVDLDNARAVLNAAGYDLSLSRVTWKQMAHFVGCRTVDDLGSFELKRAGMPIRFFEDVCSDVQCMIQQYGAHNDLRNEEARSRVLAALFTRTVALFDLLIQNRPETLIEGRISSQGEIEYYFKTFGGLTILFVEVKTSITGATEREKAIAQVIAECDGCDNENYKNNFSSVIYGILTDGQAFEFFEYDPTGSDSPEATSTPTLKVGYSTDVPLRMFLPSGPGLNTISSVRFIAELRCVSETIFWVFIKGYLCGLQAYLRRSEFKTQSDGKRRESTSDWEKALHCCHKALDLFVEATALTMKGEVDHAEEVSNKAMQRLRDSVEAAPSEYRRKVNFKDKGWAEYCASLKRGNPV